MARILVVDDEEDVLEMIHHILKRSGHHVTTARNGAECLTKLRKGKPDLVLLDIVMPGMSGFDVHRKIRKYYSGMKVAFVSVLDVTPRKRKELMKDGILDYITKPFAPDELVSRVNSIIE